MRDFIAPDLADLFGASDHISLFVWDNSPGWPVLHCTDNVKQLLGYRKEAFYRRELHFIDTLHPEDRERVIDEVKQGILRTGAKSFTHEDYRMVHADGSDVWVSDTTLIERDANGDVRYLLGYLLDITARKQLELALIAERRHLSMVLEGTRLGGWEWNPQTNELNLSDRWLAMYGYQQGELNIDMALWERLIHPDDRGGWHAALQSHLEADSPFYEHVYRMQHKRGHFVYVLDRGKVVEWDTHRRPVRMSGTHTDISAQKEAELEAREAVRSRTIFLANMSHEIRTPLHGILGLASVLEGTELDSYQRELLNTMQQSGEYLLNTLDDAIDISRADQGKLEIVQRAHATDTLVQHLQSLFQEQARRRGINYQVVADEGLPKWLLMDKSRLLQVATNLINNAFKFTKFGFIHVSFDWSEGEFRLRVRDSGMGIEDTEKVWRIFEQESEESMYPKPGGGLGLGIVKSLVDLMQGSAEVSSTPGKGSLFTIRLPLLPATQPVQTQSTTSPLPVYRILIIDDNDVNQLILGEVLSALAQIYVSASSAEMGLQVLQEQEFDVVFMDVHMPDLDGVEATRQIRRQALSQPYIIGLTANPMPAMRDNAIGAGMNAYLTKPFQLSDIRQALSDVTPLKFSKTDWQ
ncbi:PAS domain-containing protein [Aliidiomarina sp. Khilg15.8]